MAKEPLRSYQDQHSSPLDPMTINAVWEKAENEFGYTFFKRDKFGEVIAKHHFGEQSEYGWRIVMIVPIAQGGRMEPSNLQPVHWKNEHRISDR